MTTIGNKFRVHRRSRATATATEWTIGRSGSSILVVPGTRTRSIRFGIEKFVVATFQFVSWFIIVFAFDLFERLSFVSGHV